MRCLPHDAIVLGGNGNGLNQELKLKGEFVSWRTVLHVDSFLGTNTFKFIPTVLRIFFNMLKCSHGFSFAPF